MCQQLHQLWRCIYVPGRFLVQRFKSKEITMKQFIAIIAAAFAVTAFAAEPAKKEEKKAEAKPAVTATAPAASTPAPAKADVKSEKAGDKKAEAAKK
jgi:hypothetical protein